MTRRLVIFDLDETLVHATNSQLEHAPSFEHSPYFIYQRPFIRELLTATKPFYDFAVWSSSSSGYVEAVVEKVFGVEFEVKFAWAVERCVQRVHAQSNSYVYIKDLRKVQSQGYPVDRITIVDDSPEKIARQPRNHLQIKPFLGQADDRELLEITEELIRRAG
jgi:carboxy-terminal domain RNA polymerase II polypeptide A small phosphatase